MTCPTTSDESVPAWDTESHVPALYILQPARTQERAANFHFLGVLKELNDMQEVNKKNSRNGGSLETPGPLVAHLPATSAQK